jgi:hypothetical protein
MLPHLKNWEVRGMDGDCHCMCMYMLCCTSSAIGIDICAHIYVQYLTCSLVFSFDLYIILLHT